MPERFERILPGAPCSLEGRFSPLQPGSHAYWSERKIREMARKQKRLLLCALHCLKPGGTLPYSTCTLAPSDEDPHANPAKGR